MIELIVFIIAGIFAITGAVGLVLARNPVHGALSLVMSLFAVAVLFLNQDAQFLAAIQVIVYAGAIVVLFLFVIMLLGVDESEDLDIEPIAGQRPAAFLIGIGVFVLSVIVIVSAGGATGVASDTAPKLDSLTNSTISATDLLAESDDATFGVGDDGGQPDIQVDGRENNPNIDQIGRTLFTDYVFAFEVTAILLTIAVVGAVVLARRPKGELEPLPELPALVEEVAPWAKGAGDLTDDMAGDMAASDAGDSGGVA